MYVICSGRRRRRGGEWMRGLDLGFPNPPHVGSDRFSDSSKLPNIQVCKSGAIIIIHVYWMSQLVHGYTWGIGL